MNCYSQEDPRPGRLSEPCTEPCQYAFIRSHESSRHPLSGVSEPREESCLVGHAVSKSTFIEFFRGFAVLQEGLGCAARRFASVACALGKQKYLIALVLGVRISQLISQLNKYKIKKELRLKLRISKFVIFLVYTTCVLLN
jgi:hypothetical protein